MKKVLIGIMISLLLAFGFTKFYGYINEYEENTYYLDEIEDGVYLITYKVSSSIPAQNYEVATVCINGQIVDFKADLKIVYTEDEPYCVVGSYVNTTVPNDVTVYLPRNSVKYKENVGIK